MLYFLLFLILANFSEAIVDASQSYPNSKFFKWLPVNISGSHVFKLDWKHIAKYPMVLCYILTGITLPSYWWLLAIPLIRLATFDVFMKVIKKWQ